MRITHTVGIRHQRGIRVLVLAAAAAALGFGSGLASAQTTGPAQPAAAAPAEDPFVTFFKRTELSGFVDTYYGFNFNRPSTRQNQLRNFDVEHNSFDLNLAEISLNKVPTDDSRGGFRVDVDYGRATSLINASEPGGATFEHIGQAYVSYLAPTTHGLQFDIGKFYTPIGNEVVKTKDNWNYSRSLVFTLAEPYYHMGLRTTYAASDRVSVAGFLVNGWNDVTDNNGAKSVGGQVTLKPNGSLTIAETYLAGPEQANDDSDWRHLADTVVTYTATPQVSLAANYDYGHDTVTGAGVTWQGVAGYVRIAPVSWFALTPRVEYYDDGDAFSTGTSQTLTEATVTAEFAPKGGLLTRVEYRRDMSNQAFFLKNAADHMDHQDTLTVGIIYAFSTK